MKPVIVCEQPLTYGISKLLSRLAGREDDHLLGEFDYLNVRRYIVGTDGDCEVVVLVGQRMLDAYIDMTTPATSPLEGMKMYEWREDSLSPTGRRQVVVIPTIAAIKRIHRFARLTKLRGRVGRVLQEATEKASELYETRL